MLPSLGTTLGAHVVKKLGLRATLHGQDAQLAGSRYVSGSF